MQQHEKTRANEKEPTATMAYGMGKRKKQWQSWLTVKKGHGSNAWIPHAKEGQVLKYNSVIKVRKG